MRPTIKPSPDEELPAIDVTEEEAEVVEASYRLKTQARRVTAAKHVIPHFYITRSVDVTRLFSRKEELKQKYGATITHLIMLAALKALKLHPEANRSYDRGRIIKWKGINLGLAVDTDAGLTIAVIRHAQELSLKEIVERTRALVEKARSGKLSPDERRHPTFTVSSLGMFDVEQFEPIINPPSAITLAAASALPAPVVKGDKVQVGQVMKLTLSCDHRIIDGVTAAKFLAELKRLLENDAELLADE
jgi:pyruvate dehydrogenase E2 component (dihydrolipoamide acetyltransferase)